MLTQETSSVIPPIVASQFLANLDIFQNIILYPSYKLLQNRLHIVNNHTPSTELTFCEKLPESFSYLFCVIQPVGAYRNTPLFHLDQIITITLKKFKSHSVGIW